MPTPVAVKLDEDVHSRVKALAEARDRSPHWMMREAIAQYVAPAVAKRVRHC